MMARLLALAIGLLSSAMAVADDSVLPDQRLVPAKVVFVEPSSPSEIPEVYIDGYIHRPTVEAFRKQAYLQDRKVGFVYFNSHGGDLVAAMELGALIRERGFSTRVGVSNGPHSKPSPGYCESACPFAFAGGVFRFLDSQSKMGLHQFFKASGVAGETDLATGQMASTLLANHLSNLGVNMRVLEVAAQAGPQQMNYLTPLTAFELDLTNAGSLPAIWDIKAEQGIVYVMGEQSKITGTGRLGMTCNANGGVSLAAFFQAWFDNSVLSQADRFALTIDGQGYPAVGAKMGEGLKNGFSYVTFEGTTQQLQAMRSARTVGFSYEKVGTDLKAGFTIDVNEARGMIDSFSRMCAGERPSFSDRI